jgi:hypothetical protein
LEKSKAEEVSKLQVALHDMEQRIEEVTAMQERESAKKAVEEALAQEREKITLLTTEIEDLKVCSSFLAFFSLEPELQKKDLLLILWTESISYSAFLS